jgi:hypothetical protein
VAAERCGHADDCRVQATPPKLILQRAQVSAMRGSQAITQFVYLTPRVVRGIAHRTAHRSNPSHINRIWQIGFSEDLPLDVSRKVLEARFTRGRRAR